MSRENIISPSYLIIRIITLRKFIISLILCIISNNCLFGNISTIENNQDLFDRDYKYQKITIDESFPKYVLNNKTMFKEWII